MRQYGKTFAGEQVSVQGTFSGDFRDCMIRYIPAFRKLYPMVLAGKFPTSDDVSRSLAQAQSKPYAIVTFAEEDHYYLARHVPRTRHVSGIIYVSDSQKKIAEASFTAYPGQAQRNDLDIAVEVFLEKTGIAELKK